MPQLQHRFEALAAPHRMNGAARAAYAAVKAVTRAAMRTDKKGHLVRLVEPGGVEPPTS